MGMSGVIGFDQYLSGNVTQSYLNTKVLAPLAAGGNKVVDLFNPGGRLVLSHAIATDPIENRQAMKMTVVSGVGNHPSTDPYAPAGIQMPFGDNTLPKTGTWVLGCWVGSSATRSSLGANGLAGYVSYGTGVSACNPGNNTGVYIEIVMTWATGTATVYMDGVLQATWTGITTASLTPIVIGVTRWSGPGGWNWTAIGNGDYCYFRDIYFAINPTGDANPVPRLGKSRVIAHPVDSIVGTRWGTTLPSGDKAASANTPLDSTLLPVVTSSPLNDVGIVKFAPLTMPGNYSDPLFLQVDYAVTMDAGAGVKFVHQAGANAALTESLTAGSVTHFVERGLEYGNAYDQAAIAALQVKINSIPG